MSAIVRHYSNQTVAINTAEGTTAPVAIGEFSSGEVFIPTGSGITSLTYHVAEKIDGTYLPAQDSSGSPVTQTVAQTKAYPLPAAIFGAAAIKIVGNAAGNVIVNLKA